MFSDAVGQGRVRPAGTGPSVRAGRPDLSGCFVAYRHSGRISPSFRKLSARCVRSGPPYSVPRPFGGGRPVRPRNAIRTAEPLRTGSGLESRDNGKYGCPGHRGRVMNMRWGRFGSINICLLIDWCNEPTKKSAWRGPPVFWSVRQDGNPVRRSPAPDFGAGASGRVALGFKIFMLQYDSGGEYAP